MSDDWMNNNENETDTSGNHEDPSENDTVIDGTADSTWDQPEDNGWNQASTWEEKEDTTYHWVNPKLQEQRQEQQYEYYQFSRPEPEKPAKKRKSKGILKKFVLCAALALVFGMISGVTFLAITSLGKEEKEVERVQQTVPSTETGNASASVTADAGNTVATVAANAMPSVVAISNISVQEVQNFFFGTQSYESESSGSGIIVGQNDTELLIATNNHVVSGAKTITVSFIDESSVEAQIKGTDANNDLAVIAVDLSSMPEETLSKIKIATIGSSDNLVVGEQVVAIGNALGYGQSVTSGYVSALNREVTVDNVTAKLIQTDAAINPGNSGGALLNMAGELIGINAVKFASSEVEGMGYAIPVSTAQPILDELMSRETRSKVDEGKASYLGISCRNVTQESQQMYNLPSGVFVDSVTEGSAAEKSGMIKGDIITKFDGVTISTYDELVGTLQYYAAGEQVEIIVMRASNGEYQEVVLEVTLDAKPKEQQ